MHIEKQIRAWKDPHFRSTLNASEVQENPAGARLVEVGNEELRAVWGALAPDMPSQGYVCSVSGECNGGTSCWSVLAN